MDHDQVQVSLGESIDSLDGAEWPEREDGSGPDDTATIERDVELRVELADGEPFVAPSRLSFVRQRDGRVVAVSLSPLAERRPLPEAISEVRELLEGNDVLTDDLAAQLDEWQQHVAGDAAWPTQGDQLRTGTDVRGLELDVELRERAGDGWVATVELGLPVDTW